MCELVGCGAPQKALGESPGRPSKRLDRGCVLSLMLAVSTEFMRVYRDWARAWASGLYAQQGPTGYRFSILDELFGLDFVAKCLQSSKGRAWRKTRRVSILRRKPW